MATEVLWREGDTEEAVEDAFRRLAGRKFRPQRCDWEEVLGDGVCYHFRDGWVVTVRWKGCEIAQEGV